MLIKCPECNHDVSDKARVCPQCGYPISEISSGYAFQKQTMNIMTEGKEIALSTEECPICKSNKHSLINDNDVCDECGYIFKRNMSSPVQSEQSKVHRVHCPYCGSTNVKKLGYWSGGWKATYGGLQWHCNNCDSDF